MKTNSDLSKLDRPPSHRGAAERISLLDIVGWCLEARDPGAPVTLKLFCEGVFVGSTRTATNRRDISEKLGRPVNAGFSFAWTECTPERRAELIAALERCADAGAPIDLAIEIESRPASKPAVELNTAYAQSQGVPSRGQLLSRLRRMQNPATATSIALREQLLSDLENTAPVAAPACRIDPVAFYLPQFHPISENDEWWGPGFTEWTHVVGAEPLFDGHEQPRRPSELGFYDLRTPGVMERQIELALSHGLRGFCFHHYWFAGRRLLDAPLQRFLELDHELGFCLCWANETWSRRWDGSEQEILIQQPHRYETDVAFIHDVLPLMRDRRYLKVDGQPLLVVYRASLLSDAPRVIERWRQIAQESGFPGLHVCMAETFGQTEPEASGCDSSLQFFPHNLSQLTPLTLPGLVPDFSGYVFDYAQVVSQQLSAPSPSRRQYPGVMLGWDNTARRGAQGQVYRGFDPALFELWLEHCAQQAESRFAAGERYVFINAWNEWGEGSYLEPDRHWGRRNLEAVRAVAQGQPSLPTRLSWLRQRCANDSAALQQLDALQGFIDGLQQSLDYALQFGRQVHPHYLPSRIVGQRPLGLDAIRTGGRGRIERIGASAVAGHAQLRCGEAVTVSGWSLPEDQPLDESTVSFLCFEPVDADAETGTPICRYAFINRRSRREDVVSSSGLPPAQSLWSGWSVHLLSDGLPAGRYRVSVCFTGDDRDDRTAVQIPCSLTLDMLP